MDKSSEQIKEIVKSSCDRLRELRVLKNLTQQQLADKCSLKKQAISNIENGLSKPSLEIICTLIMDLNINANWLITGKGSMYIDADTSQACTNFKTEIKTELIEELKEWVKEEFNKHS